MPTLVSTGTNTMFFVKIVGVVTGHMTTIKRLLHVTHNNRI